MSKLAEQRLPDGLGHDRDWIFKLAAGSRASDVRVFGSLVSKAADTHDDIEILVDLEGGQSLLGLGEPWLAVQELLNHPIKLNTLAFLREVVRKRAQDEAILL